VQIGVSQSLVLAVIQQESGGSASATRYEPGYEKSYVLASADRMNLVRKLNITTHDAASSWGLMQLMFFTAYGYGCRTTAQLLDPDQNIRFGTAHLASLIKSYNGDKGQALAAYNGGSGGATAYAIGQDTAATRYSRNVQALYEQYKDEYMPKDLPAAQTKDVTVKPGGYFKESEFTCRCGCGTNKVKLELINTLNIIRGYIGVPITITSGTRCVKHNQKVGGVSNSNHLTGDAADFQAKGIAPSKVREKILELYNGGKLPSLAGMGSYSTFTHIDINPKVAGRLRRWNE
jgi:hypothetical protein